MRERGLDGVQSGAGRGGRGGVHPLNEQIIEKEISKKVMGIRLDRSGAQRLARIIFHLVLGLGIGDNESARASLLLFFFCERLF